MNGVWTVLAIAGVGVVGYMVYKSVQSSNATAAANAASLQHGTDGGGGVEQQSGGLLGSISNMFSGLFTSGLNVGQGSGYQAQYTIYDDDSADSPIYPY